MDNRLQGGPISRESILDLLASTHSALAQSSTDHLYTEPSRLYLSERDWWLRRITDSSRDVFRQGQWRLAIAKRLADGVKAHCRQRRWQEPSWKARTISSATRDYWQLQSSRIDWPSYVTGFSAVLPDYRPSTRSSVPSVDGVTQPNKRPRSPLHEATSPVETQRRSKRRRRATSDDPPPSVASGPPPSPTPVSHGLPAQVMAQVDSESLLFGKRLQQTFWPATCSGDGHLRWPARELEEYSARILHFMSLAACSRTEVQCEHHHPPSRGVATVEASSSAHPAEEASPTSGGHRRRLPAYSQGHGALSSRPLLKDSPNPRHTNLTLTCKIRGISGWDPQLNTFSLRVRDRSIQSLFNRLDASWTSLSSPLRSSHFMCHHTTAAPRVDDQIRCGDAAVQDNEGMSLPPKLVDIFRMSPKVMTGASEDVPGTSGNTPSSRVDGLSGDASNISATRQVSTLARISRTVTGDARVELYPCKAMGATTLYVAAEESMTDVKTLGSLLLVNYWDIGMSLRALCRLQKLMIISELQLSSGTEAEATEAAAVKGAADHADACPVESPMHPTIHGFQEYSAHGLLKSSSPGEWIRRFHAKVKIFRPANVNDPKGTWVDVHPTNDFSFLDPLSLDIPLEALLFLSRRHARDRRKSLQQVRSGASRDDAHIIVPSSNTSSFKLEQALLQSQALKSEDMNLSSAGPIGPGAVPEGSMIAVKPSLFRRSINTVNRCPSWAIALRLSAWSKLPENVWEVVPGLIASASSVGGPLFDPQAKAAANAPILRVKKEDTTLTALLTLLNRSIRVPEPIILYSRMVRQIPLSTAKVETDSLSTISNQFCLPVALAVKGPSRTMRRLEFSWNPAEELVLWETVMHQIGPLITDEILTKSDLLSLSVFIDCWKQQCTGAHGKGPLRSPSLMNVLAMVNWHFVAVQINQVLKPFDRARSPVLCEAKFISMFSEIACASFHPLGDYRLVPPIKTTQPAILSSHAPPPEPSGGLIDTPLENSVNTLRAEDRLSSPQQEEERSVPWENLILSTLSTIQSGVMGPKIYSEAWNFAGDKVEPYEVVSCSSTLAITSQIESLSRLLEECSLPEKPARDGTPVTAPAESGRSEGFVRPVWELHSFQDLVPVHHVPCQGACTVALVKSRVEKQVLYGPSFPALSVCLGALASILQTSWCVPCLGQLPADYIDHIVESPLLREVLKEFLAASASSAACESDIQALARCGSDTPSESGFAPEASSKQVKDLSEGLGRARDALQQLVHCGLEIDIQLSRGGYAFLSAMASTQAEVAFRKTWDYQESGGLISPIILRLLNDDKSKVLNREISEWDQLCLHGVYRISTGTHTPDVSSEPKASSLVRAALSKNRENQLLRLAKWMIGITAADQLIRLSGHLSLFHTNSTKRRKLLLSQEGQIENYYLDHHLRAHVHTSPSCLSMLQAMRDIMTFDLQQGEGRLDLGYREVTPATVFHHTCVNYNRIIFPCHASHERLQAESDTRLSTLYQALSSITSIDHLLQRNTLDTPPLDQAESLVVHVADAPIVAAAMLSRLPKACSVLHLSKSPAREGLPELLFHCIYRKFVPDASPTKSYFPKAPYPKLKINVEEAMKAMVTNTLADKTRREPKNRKSWAESAESPSRPSRQDGVSSSRNRSQPIQPYPQVHPYRPNTMTHMQRPPVIDFKQIPPIQQIPQSWNHVYDPNMRTPHYAMLSPTDVANQSLGQHVQMQPPSIQSYQMPSMYPQQNDPWRRSASMKPVSYQASPNTEQSQGTQHQPWYTAAHLNPDRYPQPTYIEFRPQQNPQVGHYQPTGSSAGPGRQFQHPTADYSSYYQPYLQTAPSSANTYIYGMYGIDRSAAAAAGGRVPAVSYNSGIPHQSQMQSLGPDGPHKTY